MECPIVIPEEEFTSPLKKPCDNLFLLFRYLQAGLIQGGYTIERILVTSFLLFGRWLYYMFVFENATEGWKRKQPIRGYGQQLLGRLLADIPDSRFSYPSLELPRSGIIPFPVSKFPPRFARDSMGS